MENTANGSFIRNRRLESLFNPSSLPNIGVSWKIGPKKEVGKKMKSEFYVDDYGWMDVLISWIRIFTCFMLTMVTTSIWALIMLVLLPWPYERVRQGNIYGHVTGRMLVSYQPLTPCQADLFLEFKIRQLSCLFLSWVHDNCSSIPCSSVYNQ